MAPRHPTHVLVVGAGAAGLTAARDLARAGRRVTVLEARERLGGRIEPLPAEEFGYPAEAGAEFVHGAAPLTRTLMREAGLGLAPLQGTRWSARDGALAPDDAPTPHAARLRQVLTALETDMTVADFLDRHFAEPQYGELRRSITRMVEGYDAADPKRASTFALRDEWLGRGLGQQGRVVGGYGALIAFLAAECRRHGAAIRQGAAVTAIDESEGGLTARCRDGASVTADAAVLAVPLPLLGEIALPPAAAAKAAARSDIGFGNVVKILLRFRTRWWSDGTARKLADASFLFANATVPTWWTQYPAEHPVLTGWYAGPKADGVASLAESALVAMGLGSLADIFAVAPASLEAQLLAARAINWGNDRFARGAYSYATPRTRDAQASMARAEGGVFISGEALYGGPDMGTVEAALASGRETARAILAA